MQFKQPHSDANISFFLKLYTNYGNIVRGTRPVCHAGSYPGFQKCMSKTAMPKFLAVQI